MITSVENPRVKELAKLQMKKYRDRQDQCIVEGYHLVQTAKEFGLLEQVYALKAESAYPDAVLLSEHVMKKITQAKTIPAIIGVCKTVLPTDIRKRVLFLERIQDPGNMGALIRSAVAFGFTSLVASECVDLFNPKVLRATQGALFHLSVNYFDIATFKTKFPDHVLYAAVPRTTQTQTMRPNRSVCLMLGHEGQGLSSEALQLADKEITIPMDGFESLNVSVAGGIIMHALAGQPIFKGD